MTHWETVSLVLGVAAFLLATRRERCDPELARQLRDIGDELRNIRCAIVAIQRKVAPEEFRTIGSGIPYALLKESGIPNWPPKP